MKDHNQDAFREFLSWAYEHRLKLVFGVLFFVIGLRVGIYLFADPSHSSMHDLLWGSSKNPLSGLLAAFY